MLESLAPPHVFPCEFSRGVGVVISVAITSFVSIQREIEHGKKKCGRVTSVFDLEANEEAAVVESTIGVPSIERSDGFASKDGFYVL